VDHTDKIVRARIAMQKLCPFIYLIITNMDIKPWDGRDPVRHETAWVDAYGHMRYAPEWIASLSQEEVTGVLAHEALHIALQHVSRAGTRDVEAWNAAVDAKVNDIIVSMSGRIQCPHDTKDMQYVVPQNHSWGPFSDIDKKSAEQLYDEIPKQKSKRPKAKGWDIHKFGDKSEPSDSKSSDGKPNGRQRMSQRELEGLERKWRELISQAAVLQRMKGDNPGGLLEAIDGILQASVGWRDLLYSYITNEIPVDYTYRRPSKKSGACGVYLPSTESELLRVVCALDTSGSISREQLSQFASEVAAIGATFNNVEVTLITCDAQVHDVYEYFGREVTELPGLKLRGRGGTDHRPVAEWIEHNRPDACVVVAMTDGYTSFPEDSGPQDWIWVVVRDGAQEDVFPFGRVVRIT